MKLLTVEVDGEIIHGSSREIVKKLSMWNTNDKTYEIMYEVKNRVNGMFGIDKFTKRRQYKNPYYFLKSLAKFNLIKIIEEV